LRWLPRLLLLPLALLLFRGCGPEDRGAPALYKKYCARCHGAEGQGPRRPNKLYPYLSLLASPMVRKGDRAAVRQQVVVGEGPMPSFRRRLTPAEVEQIVDFTLKLPSRKAGS
jgi:mono/diheme cytochrome c family protein